MKAKNNELVFEQRQAGFIRLFQILRRLVFNHDVFIFAVLLLPPV